MYFLEINKLFLFEYNELENNFTFYFNRLFFMGKTFW